MLVCCFSSALSSRWATGPLTASGWLSAITSKEACSRALTSTSDSASPTAGTPVNTSTNSHSFPTTSVSPRLLYICQFFLLADTVSSHVSSSPSSSPDGGASIRDPIRQFLFCGQQTHHAQQGRLRLQWWPVGLEGTLCCGEQKNRTHLPSHGSTFFRTSQVAGLWGTFCLRDGILWPYVCRLCWKGTFWGGDLRLCSLEVGLFHLTFVWRTFLTAEFKNSRCLTVLSEKIM